MARNSYDETVSLLNLSRKRIENNRLQEAINKRRLMFESDNDSDSADSIAITNDIKFGNNVLQSQIDAFKSSVNAGAKFANENPDDAKSNPLVYLPKTGNLVFSGSIPNLSNLKFQFSLMDVTNAPYIWCDGLPLTDEVITTINKLRGFYLNWKEQWLLREDLLQTLDKQSKK